MYSRLELKQAAKDQIRNDIGMLIVCTLLLSLIMGGAGCIPVVGGIAVFLFGPALTMGMIKIYMGLSKGKSVDIGDLFNSFEDWSRLFLANLLMTIYILLWSLLFIIPGIIKAYSYSMTYYILADHPEMSATEAIEESKRLMDGHKWEFFVLQLSFILWFLLCVVTCGLAAFYVTPYMSMTNVNFYHMLIGAPLNTTEAAYTETKAESTASYNTENVSETVEFTETADSTDASTDGENE